MSEHLLLSQSMDMFLPITYNDIRLVLIDISIAAKVTPRS